VLFDRTHYFMHKSIFGSLFMEALTCGRFLRENAPNALHPAGLANSAPHIP